MSDLKDEQEAVARCGAQIDLENEGRGCLNQLGGVYLNGRPLPANKRKVMIELASEGVRPCEISRILKVSNGCVSKILGRYQKTGLLGPKAVGGSRPRLLTTDVIACITKYKQRNPTMFAWEIREKLLADGVCSIEKIPSVSSINRTLKKFQYNHGMEGLTGSWESHNSAEKVWEIMIGERQEKRLNNVEQTDLRQPGIHQGNSQNRNRTTFSPEQCEVLEQEFLKGQYPDLLTREKIATETSLPEDTVKVWFSNRRAKLRREINAKHDVRESKGGEPWMLRSKTGAFSVPLSAQISHGIPQTNNCDQDNRKPVTQNTARANPPWVYPSDMLSFPLVYPTEKPAFHLVHQHSDVNITLPLDQHAEQTDLPWDLYVDEQMEHQLVYPHTDERISLVHFADRTYHQTFIGQ